MKSPEMDQERQVRWDAMEKTDDLTREVASFIFKTNSGEFPGEAIRIAKRCLMDGIGITLSGSTDRASSILRHYLEGLGGKPEASVLGSPLRLPAPAAATAPKAPMVPVV